MPKGNLMRSNRAVFIAERLIVQQRAIVARLVSKGLDAERDKELLIELQYRLEILDVRRRRFLDHRDRPVPLSYRTKSAENFGGDS